MDEEPVPFNLVEKTSGPWEGMVWRTELLTPSEARQRNSKMSGVVFMWEQVDEPKKKKGATK